MGNIDDIYEKQQTCEKLIETGSSSFLEVSVKIFSTIFEDKIE